MPATCTPYFDRLREPYLKGENFAVVREIRGMMLAALIMLPGCTDGAEASPQQDQESSVSTQDDGTVEIFEYGALSVEVTGVEEKRLGLLDFRRRTDRYYGSYGASGNHGGYSGNLRSGVKPIGFGLLPEINGRPLLQSPRTVHILSYSAHFELLSPLRMLALWQLAG